MGGKFAEGPLPRGRRPKSLGSRPIAELTPRIKPIDWFRKGYIRDGQQELTLVLAGGIEQHVPLAWRRLMHGKRHLRFCCTCGRHVMYLYEIAGKLACRRCCGFDYASQQHQRHAAARMAIKARLKIPGASANLLDPLPERRPKSSGQPTIYTKKYERLVAAAMAATEKALAVQAEYLSRRKGNVKG